MKAWKETELEKHVDALKYAVFSNNTPPSLAVQSDYSNNKDDNNEAMEKDSEIKMEYLEARLSWSTLCDSKLKEK